MSPASWASGDTGSPRFDWPNLARTKKFNLRNISLEIEATIHFFDLDENKTMNGNTFRVNIYANNSF